MDTQYTYPDELAKSYPKDLRIQFYEKRTVKIHSELTSLRSAINKEYKNRMNALDMINFYADRLNHCVILMNQTERKIDYLYYINQLYACIRNLPEPYCSIVEPKKK